MLPHTITIHDCYLRRNVPQTSIALILAVKDPSITMEMVDYVVLYLAPVALATFGINIMWHTALDAQKHVDG